MKLLNVYIETQVGPGGSWRVYHFVVQSLAPVPFVWRLSPIDQPVHIPSPLMFRRELWRAHLQVKVGEYLTDLIEAVFDSIFTKSPLQRTLIVYPHALWIPTDPEIDGYELDKLVLQVMADSLDCVLEPDQLPRSSAPLGFSEGVTLARQEVLSLLHMGIMTALPLHQGKSWWRIMTADEVKQNFTLSSDGLTGLCQVHTRSGELVSAKFTFKEILIPEESGSYLERVSGVQVTETSATWFRHWPNGALTEGPVDIIFAAQVVRWLHQSEASSPNFDLISSSNSLGSLTAQRHLELTAGR